MKLHVQFPSLERLIQKIGAETISWNPEVDVLGKRVVESIDVQLQDGLEITLDAIEFTEEGLLSFQGRQILLYIMDTRKTRDVLENDVENAPRFHICDCRTLENMRKQGRYERYVATQNDSGFFPVTYEDPLNHKTVTYIDPVTHEIVEDKIQARLMVCKYCLQRLDYKNYVRGTPRANEIWRSFSIKEFFEEYSSHFKILPRYTSDAPPSFQYPQKWAEISTAYRESVKWRCEKCGLDFSATGKRDLLHVHHKNGVKSDVSPGNLIALCATCHKEEPQHNHMHIKANDKLRIFKERVAQKKKSSFI